MPFTGSHPAAVLPLIRLGLTPSALVIGSMVPDLPYYLPLGVDSANTHSATGIVGLDLLTDTGGRSTAAVSSAGC